MKAHITITDDNGTVFEGDAELVPVGRAPKAHRSLSAKPRVGMEAEQKVDFSKNERAFIKTYARKMSGVKKFVLLLAYLAKGKVGQEVELKEIQKHWNRMTAMLGKFNRFHTNSAKERGWVDTKKQGMYVLGASWKEVLKGNNG